MSHPGTYVNAPTLGVPGLVPGDPNTAVAFASASSQNVVQASNIAAQTFTAFTIGCIVKPVNASDANFPAICEFGDGSSAIALGQSSFSSPTSFNINVVPLTLGAGFFIDGATTIIAGSTYRLIGTFDGTTAKLYVNGAVDGTDTSYVGGVDIDAQPFRVALDPTGPAYFNGTVDEVFFVPNHAATPTEVATIDAAMTGTGNIVNAVNALSPYLYWRLGESSGTVAADSAGTASGNLYTPPIAYDMGPINPDTRGLQRLLFRHYSPHGRFQTVWKLATNPITYSLSQPYPLITPQDVQQGNMPIGQTYNAATYLHVYYGPEQVSDAEAARLIASGIGTVT